MKGRLLRLRDQHPVGLRILNLASKKWPTVMKINNIYWIEANTCFHSHLLAFNKQILALILYYLCSLWLYLHWSNKYLRKGKNIQKYTTKPP